jgi:prepilin-type N-terminal cleavage/methylation domain-containing protein
MTRRKGVTLIEVLVAIFVMGIGLLALLTLFPIGVLRMAQAIHDSRSAQAAHNADRICLIQNVRNDVAVVTQPGDPYSGGGINSDLFNNPCPFYAGVVPPFQLPDADPYAESYPIFVDPIGFRASVGPGQDWVGGVPGTLRRRPITQFASNVFVLNNFSLWDDINFESTITNPVAPPGAPQNVAGVAMRDSRFSWGYVLRRPHTSDRSVVDCTTVVFDKRSLSLAGNLTLPEIVYQNAAYFNPADSTITIDYGASATTPIPPIRPGNWIMDATVYSPKPGKGSTSAFFYRVVASEQLNSGSLGRAVVRFEVQQPLRGSLNKYTPVPDPLGSGTTVYRGTVIVMEGIAEVFERGTARMQ